MIKRALGLWVDGTQDSDGDSSDADEVTEVERQKLYRRMLPGASEGSKRGGGGRGRGRGRVAARPDGRPVDSDDSSDAEEGAGDAEESAEEAPGKAPKEPESDDDVVMPAEQRELPDFRGEFHCKLCPDKIILNEKAMEAHLNSNGHKRNERRFEHAKSVGLEAYEAECMERLKAREAAKDGNGTSLNAQKNKEYWKDMRKRALEKSKKDKAKGIQKELSEDKIAALKAKFQAKKARRMARKEAAATQEVPEEAGKKKKAKQLLEQPATEEPVKAKSAKKAAKAEEAPEEFEKKKKKRKLADA
mmetsp:Transcript_74955/g.219573  ORF Transcript_74955/g.219573 Transcript_74955/m.219573 type:complete len:303 (-) Transcript_74955:78-986(-)